MKNKLIFVLLVIIYFVIIKVDFNNLIFQITILLPLFLIILFQIIKIYIQFKNNKNNEV